MGYCWRSGVVMVKSFNFDLLEAKPEAFGRPLLDRGTESDRKMTSNNTHAHIESGLNVKTDDIDKRLFFCFFTIAPIFNDNNIQACKFS